MNEANRIAAVAEDSWAKKAERYGLWLLGGTLLVFLLLCAIRPITDPDFWWHLKTGEAMARQGGLLQSDPFSFAGDGVTSSREAIILKGYWLWQIAAYGLYALLGFNGIFLLNLLTAGAIVVGLALQMRRQQVSPAVALPLMALGLFLFMTCYDLERPQIASFLLALLLLGLLSGVRDGGRLDWKLPCLMILWANLHGGFVVGDLILLAFALGVAGEYRHDLPRMQHLLLWSAAGIGASLLNPNGGLVFAELLRFQNSALMSGVTEYRSTWSVFNSGERSVAILWLLILFYAAGVWTSRRLFWPELAVALFLAYFSFRYQRNIAFFTLAMLPSVAWQVQEGIKRRQWRIPPLFAGLLMLLAAAGLLWKSGEVWRQRRAAGVVSPFYPEKSTQFILSSGLQGRMFNTYDFGGYQLWNLYPRYQVFIDGRGLDADVFRDWKAMTGASLQAQGGRNEFEVLLDRYAIDFVVQPYTLHELGRLVPLLKFLLVKPEWMPIYVDRQGYILVRNSPKNAAVIARYQIDKHVFNQTVIAHLTALGSGAPTEVIHQVALAEMLIFVGRYDEAEARLAAISRLQPDHPDLATLRNQLVVLKNRKQ